MINKTILNFRYIDGSNSVDRTDVGLIIPNKQAGAE